jgi:dTDP-4-dehydrorhamnose 3,5-epimerase
MRFTETRLAGAFIVDLEEHRDARGIFARTFCAREFAQHGLVLTIAQSNVAVNYSEGTLRGLHFQVAPVAETKLVRCLRGAIYDVIVDMRPDSPTYLQHLAVELTEDNHRSLYIPEMFAHGYLTLEDHTQVIYQMGDFYTAGFERGLRYDDPSLGIEWPSPIRVISEKDTAWPLLASVPSPTEYVEGQPPALQNADQQPGRTERTGSLR